MRARQLEPALHGDSGIRRLSICCLGCDALEAASSECFAGFHSSTALQAAFKTRIRTNKAILAADNRFREDSAAMITSTMSRIALLSYAIS